MKKSLIDELKGFTKEASKKDKKRREAKQKRPQLKSNPVKFIGRNKREWDIERRERLEERRKKKKQESAERYKSITFGYGIWQKRLKKSWILNKREKRERSKSIQRGWARADPRTGRKKRLKFVEIRSKGRVREVPRQGGRGRAREAPRQGRIGREKRALISEHKYEKRSESDFKKLLQKYKQRKRSRSESSQESGICIRMIDKEDLATRGRGGAAIRDKQGEREGERITRRQKLEEGVVVVEKLGKEAKKWVREVKKAVRKEKRNRARRDREIKPERTRRVSGRFNIWFEVRKGGRWGYQASKVREIYMGRMEREERETEVGKVGSYRGKKRRLEEEKGREGEKELVEAVHIEAGRAERARYGLTPNKVRSASPEDGTEIEGLTLQSKVGRRTQSKSAIVGWGYSRSSERERCKEVRSSKERGGISKGEVYWWGTYVEEGRPRERRERMGRVESSRLRRSELRKGREEGGLRVSLGRNPDKEQIKGGVWERRVEREEDMEERREENRRETREARKRYGKRVRPKDLDEDANEEGGERSSYDVRCRKDGEWKEVRRKISRERVQDSRIGRWRKERRIVKSRKVREEREEREGMEEREGRKEREVRRRGQTLHSKVEGSHQTMSGEDRWQLKREEEQVEVIDEEEGLDREKESEKPERKENEKKKCKKGRGWRHVEMGKEEEGKGCKSVRRRAEGTWGRSWGRRGSRSRGIGTDRRRVVERTDVEMERRYVESDEVAKSMAEGRHEDGRGEAEQEEVGLQEESRREVAFEKRAIADAVLEEAKRFKVLFEDACKTYGELSERGNKRRDMRGKQGKKERRKVREGWKKILYTHGKQELEDAVRDRLERVKGANRGNKEREKTKVQTLLSKVREGWEKRLYTRGNKDPEKKVSECVKRVEGAKQGKKDRVNMKVREGCRKRLFTQGKKYLEVSVQKELKKNKKKKRSQKRRKERTNEQLEELEDREEGYEEEVDSAKNKKRGEILDRGEKRKDGVEKRVNRERKEERWRRKKRRAEYKTRGEIGESFTLQSKVECSRRERVEKSDKEDTLASKERKRQGRSKSLTLYSKVEDDQMERGERRRRKGREVSSGC